MSDLTPGTEGDPKDVNADGKNADGQPGDGNAGGKAPKTYTQEEMNVTIRERLKRQEKKYADYADLKKAASEWEAHQENQKTELQKLEETVLRLEGEKADAIQATNDAILKAAFSTEAGKLGAQFPEDAHLLVDLSEFEVEGGKVDGVEEAVKALVDSGRLPIKISKQKAPDINAGTGGKAPAGEKYSDEEKKELAAIYGVDVKYIE
jgi:hypothetical protein